MPDRAYYDSLPKKYMGAGVLIVNDRDEILIVKTTYKDNWEIPGGGVGQDESPKSACERELKEELGLERAVGDLLVMDHYPANEIKGDNLMFVFDGGLKGEVTIWDKREIAEAKFMKIEEAVKLLGSRLGPRMKMAVKAKKEKRTICLEQGKEE